MVADYDKTECLETSHYDAIHQNDIDHIRSYQISSLRTYKLYKISIALISISNHLGVFSKPITIRTMEACK